MCSPLSVRAAQRAYVLDWAEAVMVGGALSSFFTLPMDNLPQESAFN